MCGITGSIGSQQAAKAISEGLALLEYRGYDSAGMAFGDENGLKVVKRKGRLQNVIDALTEDDYHYHLGIGHTRWATHGVPTEFNAHPHVNENNTIAVVHNGIIENHQALREELSNIGYTFYSETDTEVLAKLLDNYYTGDAIDAIRKVVERVRGAYALGILFAGDNTLYAVRHESPLLVGVLDNGYMIASDIPALLPYTRKVIYLENGDLVKLKEDEITIYDESGQSIQREAKRVDWTLEAASMEGFPHFMLKEIHEQPKTTKATIDSYYGQDGFHFESLKTDLTKYKNIWIVACGTAYHAGLVGKTILEKRLRIPVINRLASEFKYENPLIDEESLLILVSQSGETADTLAALKEGKNRGAHTLAITNVVGSSIAREADSVIYTRAGQEISVASTKAYTSQLTVFALLSLYLQSMIEGKVDEKAMDSLLNLSVKMDAILRQAESIETVAQMFTEVQSAFYLGRLADWTTAMEGALKLKEITYVYTEAFAAGELKHGPIALIEEGTPVVAIATQESVFEKILSNIAEVKSRGARVIGIAREDHPEIAEICEHTIMIPTTEEDFFPLLAVIPTQLLAYYTAVAKGLNVDKPRNLAKSVTVE